jgi:hypothetical protein
MWAAGAAVNPELKGVDVFLILSVLVMAMVNGDLQMASSGNPDVAAVVKIARKAPPLPEPSGRIVRVGTAAELQEAVATAADGTTILVADGTYLTGDMELRRNAVDVSIRGASGDREKVVIDCRDQFVRGIILRGARNVMIADLTIQNTKYGVFFYGDSDIDQLVVRNVRFHNIWVRGIKGTDPRRIGDSATHLYSRQHAEKIRPRGGRIEYCLFLNDHKKQDTNDGFNGDYVSGMDMAMVKDWTVADNVFVGIRGAHGGGRGAIFIWVESEDVIAERNVIINCDRGIAFGNPSSVPPHMTRGVARNNFIVGGSIQALEFHQVVDCIAANNTIVASKFENLWHVEVGRHCSGVRFYNNLVHGKTRFRDGQVEQKGNIVGSLTGWFVDPGVCDLHLTAKAADALGAAVPLPEVTGDFDGQKRKARPDIGADEVTGPSPERQQRVDPEGAVRPNDVSGSRKAAR